MYNGIWRIQGSKGIAYRARQPIGHSNRHVVGARMQNLPRRLAAREEVEIQAYLLRKSLLGLHIREW